jgi:hypothetical protein
MSTCRFRPVLQFVAIAVILAAFTQADAANYSETMLGDISGDRLNPTQFVLSAGVNSLTATSGAFGEEEIMYDREYVRIDLPANHQLDAIRLQVFDSIDGSAFIGVQGGTTFTFDADDAIANIGNLLGYSHFGPNEDHNIGDDLLPIIGAGLGATGFAPPLTGASYTFWIQQTGAETTYQLDFVVSAIPEPSSVVMLGMLSLWALMLPRRSHRGFC